MASHNIGALVNEFGTSRQCFDTVGWLGDIRAVKYWVLVVFLIVII